jgi:hypothetical protein
MDAEGREANEAGEAEEAKEANEAEDKAHRLASLCQAKRPEGGRKGSKAPPAEASGRPVDGSGFQIREWLNARLPNQRG